MNREEAKELLPIIQAFADEKDIQFRCDENSDWQDVKRGEGLTFNHPSSHYRIKTEPKYRPFRTQEECWEEMHKHPDFGWVKDSIGNGYKQILRIWDKGIDVLVYTNISNTFELAFRLYTFIDDAPFGMKDYRL